MQVMLCIGTIMGFFILFLKWPACPIPKVIQFLSITLMTARLCYLSVPSPYQTPTQPMTYFSETSLSQRGNETAPAAPRSNPANDGVQALPPPSILNSFLAFQQHMASVVIPLIPVLFWISLFSSTKTLTVMGWLPTVDTTTLPYIDTALVGQPAHLYFDSPASISKSRDILAWILYGIWHYVSAAVCVIWLAYWGWKRHVGLNELIHTAKEELILENQPDPRSITPLQPPSPETIRAYQAILQIQTKLHQKILVAAMHLKQLDQAITLSKAFLVVFGSVNLTGVILQDLFPTAPPWYNLKYGTAIPSDPLAVRGDPAGLARIDLLLGTPFYETLFAHNPLVFGAFPSLHSGFATCIGLFVCDNFPWIQLPFQAHWIQRTRKWLRRVQQTCLLPLCHQDLATSSFSESYVYFPTLPLGVLYVLSIWWATLYLTHHFLIDLIGGSLLTFLIYIPVRWKIVNIRMNKQKIPFQYEIVETQANAKMLDGSSEDELEMMSLGSHRRQVSTESSSSGFHQVG
jgi:hypothetical protein